MDYKINEADAQIGTVNINNNLLELNEDSLITILRLLPVNNLT